VGVPPEAAWEAMPEACHGGRAAGGQDRADR
jgi:hypothetical protein